MPKQKLTADDVKHLAKLSAIQLTDEEVTRYQQQLSDILNYVEQLAEVDTKNVESTSQTTGTTNVYFEDGKKCERQFSQEEAIGNNPKHKDGYFIVDRIL